ncbi:B12-binding domain-containing radical SAM protein [candidate division KSB1 bacterium]
MQLKNVLLFGVHYTNIPIYAKNRNTKNPAIIVGGTTNLHPIQNFADIISFGDCRIVLPSIIERIRAARKQSSVDKWKNVLSGLKHCIIGNLNYGLVHAAPYLPVKENMISTVWSSTNTVYGKSQYTNILSSIGCSRQCPFCVIGNCYLPPSAANYSSSIKEVISLAENGRHARGAELVRLLLASSFQFGMRPLKQILALLVNKNFKVLTGSLSQIPFDVDLCRLLKAAGQENIIFAPETSTRLRQRIGKNLYTNEILLEWAEKIPGFGFKLILYIMVGLPGETDLDLDNIGKMLSLVQNVLNKNKAMLEIHINQVFPKPHTPFEWKRPLTIEESYKRVKRVTSHLAGIENRDYKLYTVLGSLTEFVQMWLYAAECDVAIDLVSMAKGKMRLREIIWNAESIANSKPFSDVEQLPWKNVVYSDHNMLKERYDAINTL